MRANLGKGAVALVLLAGILIASIAVVGTRSTTQLALNGQQLDTILAAISSEPTQAAPVNFTGEPGSTVPESIELKTLPREVVMSIHAASGLQFAKLRKRILLVDASTRQIMHVIYQPGAPAPRRPPQSGRPAV